MIHNKNPDNSSLVQMINDCEKALIASSNPDAPRALKKLKALRNALQPDMIADTDRLYDRHKYNDTTLTFAKISNLAESAITLELSPNARSVLLYAVQIMSQDNIFVINQTKHPKLIGMSKPTLNKALRELEEMGCISAIKQVRCSTTQSPITGTLYMLNPAVACIGSKKSAMIATYEKTTPKEAIGMFAAYNRPHYSVVHSFAISDNNSHAIKYTDITIITQPDTYDKTQSDDSQDITDDDLDGIDVGLDTPPDNLDDIPD